MGIMNLIRESKLKIRQHQARQFQQREIKMERSKTDLKALKEREDHYKRLQRIEQKKANIRSLKSTPLKRIQGVLNKAEPLPSNPFSLGKSEKEEKPFNIGRGNSPFV